MRIIAHIDMDAFFAAIEERDNPRLAGKPIVVGGDPRDGHGRGIVATANYKAREYGIHSAMPIATAWRKAEEYRVRGAETAVFVIPRFRGYGQTSERIFTYLRSQVQAIEQTSVDEAYLDLSFTGSYDSAVELGRYLQEQIQMRERLTCSVGIGPNKLIAKIASDREKPHGFTVVQEQFVQEFLTPLPVRVLPGVGPKTEEFLAKKGIHVIGDVLKYSEQDLFAMMGKWGSELFRKARGISTSPVAEGWEAKSVGEQETFGEDTRDPIFIGERMKALANDVWRRFKKDGFITFKRIVITVRFADFETRTRSYTLKSASDEADVLQFEAMRLILPFFDVRENPLKKKIRLVGVRVEQIN